MIVAQIPSRFTFADALTANGGRDRARHVRLLITLGSLTVFFSTLSQKREEPLLLKWYSKILLSGNGGRLESANSLAKDNPMRERHDE